MSEYLEREDLLNWLANVVGESVIVEDMDPGDVADVFREAADYLDDHDDDIEDVINTHFGDREDPWEDG